MHSRTYDYVTRELALKDLACTVLDATTWGADICLRDCSFLQVEQKRQGVFPVYPSLCPWGQFMGSVAGMMLDCALSKSIHLRLALLYKLAD